MDEIYPNKDSIVTSMVKMEPSFSDQVRNSIKPIPKKVGNSNPLSNGVLNDNEIDVDQDILKSARNNKTLIVVCGCFNWL